MIGQLTGKLIPLGPTSILIDVNGVGYEVFVSQTTQKTLDFTLPQTLLTYLAVKENALELYGFATLPEKDLFTKLINVPGIGPKSALAILSLASLETLLQAIARGDAGYLTTVSGIGRKSAEKIILELKDKVSPLSTDVNTGNMNDVFDALIALGYNPRDVRDAVAQLPKEAIETNDQIKEALKLLGKK